MAAIEHPNFGNPESITEQAEVLDSVTHLEFNHPEAGWLPVELRLISAPLPYIRGNVFMGEERDWDSGLALEDRYAYLDDTLRMPFEDQAYPVRVYPHHDQQMGYRLRVEAISREQNQ